MTNFKFIHFDKVFYNSNCEIIGSIILILENNWIIIILKVWRNNIFSKKKSILLFSCKLLFIGGENSLFKTIERSAFLIDIIARCS